MSLLTFNKYLFENTADTLVRDFVNNRVSGANAKGQFNLIIFAQLSAVTHNSAIGILHKRIAAREHRLRV
jgi:hypothetical protein